MFITSSQLDVIYKDVYKNLKKKKKKKPRKTPVLESLVNKVAHLPLACNFVKTRLQYKHAPVNFFETFKNK